MSMYLNFPFSVKQTTGIFSNISYAYMTIFGIYYKQLLFQIHPRKKTKMNEVQIFINSLKTQLQSFQSGITDVFLKRKPLSQKIRSVSLETLSLKTDILKGFYSLFQKLVRKQQQTQSTLKQSLTQLGMQIKNSQDKIFKINLHNLLRKKLSKLKEESIVNSMNLSNNKSYNISYQGQSKINQLQNSVVILEKQLGFQQDQDDFGVSNIIHKSMVSLQHSHVNFIKNHDASSILSQNSIVADIQTFQNYTQNDSKQSNSQSTQRDANVQMKIKSFTINDCNQDTKIVNSQKQQKGLVSKDSLSKTNRRVIKSNKPPTASNDKQNLQGSKFTKGSNMLGNLLQQSYHNYLND